MFQPVGDDMKIDRVTEEDQTACRNIIHGARGLAVGVLTPIPLRLGLGQPRSGGSAHQKTTRRSVRSPAQGIKADLEIKQDPGRLEYESLSDHLWQL